MKSYISLYLFTFYVKFGRIVPQFNMHQLMASDFQFDIPVSAWQPLHHFIQKTAVTRWSEREAPGQLQFLIGSTFVLVVSVADWVVYQQHRARSCRLKKVSFHHTVVEMTKKYNTGKETNTTNYGINVTSLNYNLFRCNSAFPNILLFLWNFGRIGPLDIIWGLLFARNPLHIV